MTWVTFDVNPENLPANLRVQEWQGKPMFWQDPDGTIRTAPNGPVAQTTYIDRDTGIEKSYFDDPEKPAWDTSKPATSPIVTSQAYGGYLGGLDLANIADWEPYRQLMGQASNAVLADRGDNSMLGFLKDKGLMAFLGPLVAGGISSAIAPGATAATGPAGGIDFLAANDAVTGGLLGGGSQSAVPGFLSSTADLAGLNPANWITNAAVPAAGSGGLTIPGMTVDLANSANLIPTSGAGGSLGGLPNIPTGGIDFLKANDAVTGGNPLSTASGGATATSSATGGSAATKWLADKLGVSEGAIQALGAGASTLLGMYQESQKSGALNDLAQQYANYGAPSRARYEASFGPGFNVATADPAFAALKDQTSESLLRKLSATGGNPFGNPGGLIEANKQIGASLDAPWLQNYRNQNAATGGYGAFNTAAPSAAMTAAGNDNNWMSVLGGGISNILNPPQQTNASTLADLLKKYALA